MSVIIENTRMARQAIRTRFAGPTGFNGPRVIASANAGRFVHHWEHRLGSEENHALAAIGLCEKLDWHGRLVAGGLGADYVFVFTEEFPAARPIAESAT